MSSIYRFKVKYAQNKNKKSSRVTNILQLCSYKKVHFEAGIWFIIKGFFLLKIPLLFEISFLIFLRKIIDQTVVIIQFKLSIT